MSSLTTKKAIAYTFKDLLKEKPFNKITINDIIDIVFLEKMKGDNYGIKRTNSR